MNFSYTTNFYLNIAWYLFIALCLFGISILLVKKFITIAYKYKVIDIPNDRSSHTLPTARGGGVVIVLLSEMLIVVLYYLGHLQLNVALALSCSFIVSIVGFLDDLIKLSAKSRFVVQFVASLIAVFLILPVNSNNLISMSTFLMSVIFIIWSTNLFNFMDGTDGLAAVEAIFVLVVSGFLLYLVTGNIGFSGCLALIGVIVSGFLCFNFPPARIFMGDVGSCFLGFLIGISALISHFIFDISGIFWLIIYAAFCFDATVTLSRRIISGEKWYLSHRSHAYQRLQNIGWQHKKILYGLIVINCCLVVLACAGYYYDNLLAASCGVLILLSTVYLLIGSAQK